MKYHMIAFFCGFLLDLMLGDPRGSPHPVRFIGSMIAELEEYLSNHVSSDNVSCENDARRHVKEIWSGALLVVIVLLITFAVSGSILFLAYYINVYLGTATEAVMTYWILAVKCLKDESMKVYFCLKDGALTEARKAVSMIVGRDTERLDEEEITKAAVETVAENTSDGVIAPMLYTALGGPVLGLMYKAVNTMDSMIGYKNDRYLYFGRSAAKLDDAVNFIPARISACLLTAAAFLGGKSFSGKRAFIIYRRDNKKHESPNSAQTESVCAGALGIRLAGDASYFGRVVNKPYIGDALRKVEYEDIRRVNRLMYIAAFLCEFVCLLVMSLAYLG